MTAARGLGAGLAILFDTLAEEMLRRLSIPKLESIAWYAGRSLETDSAEFGVLTIWQDMDALKKYTGEDWEKAVIPEEEIPVLADLSASLQGTRLTFSEVHPATRLPGRTSS